MKKKIIGFAALVIVIISMIVCSCNKNYVDSSTTNTTEENTVGDEESRSEDASTESVVETEVEKEIEYVTIVETVIETRVEYETIIEYETVEEPTYIDNYDTYEPSIGLELKHNDDFTWYVASIGTCTDSTIVVPMYGPDGNYVTKIGASCFCHCAESNDERYSALTNIKEVILPNSIVEIGDSAFSDCYRLEKINIPIGVTVIGSCVFSFCDSLSEVYLPYTLRTLGIDVFFGCSNLNTLVLDDKYPNQRYYASDNCLVDRYSHAVIDGTNMCKIPNDPDITRIVDDAFTSRNNLRTIIIPNNIIEFGNDVFYGCANLTEVIVLSDEIHLVNDAFSYSNNLTIYCTASHNPFTADGLAYEYLYRRINGRPIVLNYNFNN